MPNASPNASKWNIVCVGYARFDLRWPCTFYVVCTPFIELGTQMLPNTNAVSGGIQAHSATGYEPVWNTGSFNINTFLEYYIYQRSKSTHPVQYTFHAMGISKPSCVPQSLLTKCSTYILHYQPNYYIWI